MTPEDQAKVPVYFSAFGQIDDVSSQQEAPNGAELRKVLIPALTTAVVPIITPENISPESKTIINELKNYVLPKTGKDSEVGPGIMMRIINSINKGEIVSLEGLRELVNSTGKPIIADGRVLSKYPSFCVSEEQNKIFSQQGVSLIISTNDVNLTTINTSEVASDNEFIFGKTLGETVNPFINFTSESITQGLVRPGCNGYLMPTSDDMGILVTPDDYTSEELSAEVAQEAPDMASNAITTNNYSYLAVIGHAGVIDLFAK